MDEATYILRESMRVTWEAPFLYLLLGSDRALLLDTGAVADGREIPLALTVRSVLDNWVRTHDLVDYELVVTHTHGHNDHTRGDAQFTIGGELGSARVTVIDASIDAVQQFFGFGPVQDEVVSFDLGGRELLVSRIPGHDARSIVMVDPTRRMMFSGDTAYPGWLYVQDLPALRESLDQMVHLAQEYDVRSVLGGHIEFAGSGGQYPAGVRFHDDELPLPLTGGQLQQLRDLAHSAAAIRGVVPGTPMSLWIGPCRHRSLARAASCAGPRPGTVRFATNWAATSGATCSRDRPLFGRRLLAAHLCGAQCGHPLPFMTRLTTVASQDPPQDPHRHRHRSNELGRHRDSAHPELVMFSTNSATTCGATLAAVAPSALGRRRAAALARFLHIGQPLPDARLETLALHTCAQLGQRHSQRWLDPGRRSGGAMSGRSRLRTNCAASSGLRSESDAPAGSCAWVRARTCLAHSGHPPLALRAAGGASHS